MKIFQSILSVALLFSLTSCATPQTWVSLFDGQSLGKWRGDVAVWRVENGYISGKAERVEENTFLIYPDTFNDFILEAEVMLIEAKSSFPNSGIQFRSRTTGQFSVQGYQVDLGQTYWGSLYDEGTGPMSDTTPQAIAALKKDNWNKVVIEAQGQNVNVTLNGVEAAQYQQATVSEGIIALQYHAPGENFEIRFRNIRIRELE